MDVGRLTRRLRAVGADVEITDAGVLLEGVPVRLETMGRRPATPSDLKRVAEMDRIADGAGTTAVVISAGRASDQAVDWVRAHPEVTLVLDDRVILGGEQRWLDERVSTPVRRKGPVPYARFAVARCLLFGAPRVDQAGLAALAGVTQGSVSNALRRIPEIQDPGAFFDALVRDYPGAGGQSFYWWGSTAVHEQAQHLAAHGALLSGDFAADRIAPWRKPERVVAYTDRPLNLADDGYLLVEPGDFSTLVIVPRDLTIRSTAAAWRSERDAADPVIAASDILRTATTGDQDEAVERLRDAVINRFHEVHRG